MPGLHFEITADNSQLLRALRQTEQRMAAASSSAEAEGGRIDAVFQRLSRSAAAFGAGFTAKEIVSQVATVRGEFQKLEVAFRTMLGSKEQADALMAQLVQTAATTPFDLQGVANGARQLLAYGERVENVNDDLIRLGDIAAGLSQPLGDLVYLYGTTMTQGRLYTADLNQFTGRGIPMIRELAKVLGVAESEVRSLVEAGKVGFPEVQQVIQNLTNEGGMFYNLMKEQSKTISGQISNLADSFQTMLNEVGQENEGLISGAIGAASKLVENYEEVGRTLMGLAASYGAYRAVLMAVAAAQRLNVAVLAQAVVEKQLAAAAGIALSNAEAVAAARTKLLTVAQTGLARALKAAAAAALANPYVLAAAAVASLTYAVYHYATAATEAEAAQEGFDRSVEKSNERLDERRRRIEELMATIRSSDTSGLQRQMAFDELERLAPALTEAYDSVERLAGADLTAFNRQVAEMTDAEREADLRRQIGLMQEYADTIERYVGGQASLDEGLAAYRGLRDLGVEAPDFATWSSWAETAREQASLLRGELSKIEEAKEKLAVPTAMDVELSRRSYEQTAERFRLLDDFARALRDEVEGAPVEFPLDPSDAARRTDEALDAVRSRADELRRQQREHPIEFNADARRALDEYDRLLRQIATWRDEARRSGTFTIPIFFQFEEQAAASAKQRFNYLTGRYEEAAAGAKKTTLAEAYADAQKAYDEARERVGRMEADRSAYTAKEYTDAAEALKEAKKKFEELGGETQTDKQAAAAERRRQQQLRRQQRDEQKAQRERLEARREADEALLALERQTEQERIGLMAEGTERELAEIRLDYDRRMDEIGQQEERLREANRKAGRVDTGEDGLTEEQALAIGQARLAAIRAREQAEDKLRADEARRDEEAMDDYLRRYGQYEERRLALTRQYEGRIREARTEGERLSLGRERDEALAALDLEEFKRQIDFADVFDRLEAQGTEALRRLAGQLRQYINEQAAALAPSDLKDLSGALSRIEAEVAGREPMKAVIEGLRRWRAAADEVREAQEALDEATERGSAWVEEYDAATGQLTRRLIDRDEAERRLREAQGREGEGREQAARGMEGAAGSISRAVSDMQAVAGTLSEVFGVELGEDVEKLLAGGERMSEGLSRAAQSLLSGDVFGAVSGVVGMVGGAFEQLEGIAGLFGYEGDSDPRLMADIERLTASNRDLEQAVSGLAERMEEVSVAEASGVYQQQVENIREMARNTQEMMARSAAAYDNGLLGVGGTHSSGSKVDAAMSREEWRRISEIVGRTVSSAGDFWQLTSEQMYDVSLEATDLYSKIKQAADDGYRDAAQFMDQYIGYWQQLREVEDSYRERLTSTSFDSVSDDFRRALLDMETDAEAFADSFEELMREAVLGAMMSETYEGRLRDWYERFAGYMEGGSLTANEMDALRREWEAIVGDAKEEWQAWQQALGLAPQGGAVGGEQGGATSGGFEAMGQDTAEELNGRFTGVQIASERAADAADRAATAAGGLVDLFAGAGSQLDALLAGQALSNGYLEEIAAHGRRLSAIQASMEKIARKMNEL